MTYLYRAYDAAGALLYVGIAEDWHTRLNTHQGSPWFNRAESLTLEDWPDRQAAAKAERAAIRSERPIWNIRDSPNPEAARALHRAASTPVWRPSTTEAEFESRRAKREQEFEERLERLFRLQRGARRSLYGLRPTTNEPEGATAT